MDWRCVWRGVYSDLGFIFYNCRFNFFEISCFASRSTDRLAKDGGGSVNVEVGGNGSRQPLTALLPPQRPPRVMSGCRRPACVESALRVEAVKSCGKTDIGLHVSAYHPAPGMPLEPPAGLTQQHCSVGGAPARGEPLTRAGSRRCVPRKPGCALSTRIGHWVGFSIVQSD